MAPSTEVQSEIQAVVDSARTAQTRCLKKLDADIEDARGHVRQANFSSDARELHALEHLAGLLQARCYLRKHLNES